MRRTKADAELTRQHIIAAARRVFAERGVSRASLEQVAAAAGTTRGAIYWHFANKIELFYAMRNQVSLPLLDRMGVALLGEETDDPLQAIEESILEIVRGLEEDEEVRETFGIVSLKCEYVGEFGEVLAHLVGCMNQGIDGLTRAYAGAQRRGLLRPGLDPALLALETQTFMFGLLRLWLVDADGTTVRPRARELVHSHVESRRA